MVRKIADYITKYCYTVFVIFLVLAGICGFLSQKVSINHDIYSYMPADSETTLGLNIMKDEFDYGSTSSWKMMIEDLPHEKHAEIKSYLEGVENIKSVAHEDNDEYVREYNGHQYALYDITLNAPSNSDIANKAYNEIDKKIRSEYKVYVAGEVADNNGSVVSFLITGLAIGVAMLILTLMSESFIEPWLYLFAILIAVLLNKGTNILFSNVSHITDSISMILQMALSMDYAIMLSSRYRQEKAGKDQPSKSLAMNRALRYSFGAIMSSSVTTIVGLLVLIFMSFTIGRDMGFVLSKGVLLSLVSIFTTLPALLLLFDRLITKTHKKTLKFKLGWLGKGEYRFRKLAIPVFVLIFGGAFFLKGNTGILFTGSENNFVKDVFPITNQTAVVYRNENEERLAELCRSYNDKSEVKRALCYANTIGEPEKYNEIIAKANELGKTSVSGQGAGNIKTVSAEDYLVKVIYYYYYRGNNHEMDLVTLARFLRDTVLTDETFSGDLSAGERADIKRLVKFIIPEEAVKPRSREELASLFETDTSDLDDLFVLYLSKYGKPVRLTLLDFARFVNSNVLTNPNYAKLVTSDQREKLSKLLVLSNPDITNTTMNTEELAGIFGLPTETIEQILTYYNYASISEPTIKATPSELIHFALTNERVLNELSVTAKQANTIISAVDDAREKIQPYLEEYPALSNVLGFIRDKYSYGDFLGYYDSIRSHIDDIRDEVINLKATYNIDIDVDTLIFDRVAEYEGSVDTYFDKLKQIYILYQTENTKKQATPSQLVKFLAAHLDDDLLGLSGEQKSLISLANIVIDNQGTYFSAEALSNTFGLDIESLKLVYALYDYRYETGDPMLSISKLIDFLRNTVFNDARFSERLSSEKKAKINAVANLMDSAKLGTKYDYNELYHALQPLSNGIDKNQLALLYLYHGSLYDYNESWTLTIEEFVRFLNDSIVNNEMFASRISDERRDSIMSAKDTVKEAKALLVGPKHSRILIETEMAAEGDETFGFLSGIKDDLKGLTAKSDYYLVGDSAMAYEMSQSFGDEINFITILTMAAIFVVVAFTFRSILIPLLLVFVIQTAVYVTMAYLSITGQSIYFIALIIVQAILMGATIDYAILFASYYLEERKYFDLGVRDALIASYQKSIHSILTSACILIFVTAIVGNMATAIAAKICQSISVGTLVASLIILFILPALLAAFDRFIIKQKKQ